MALNHFKFSRGFRSDLPEFLLIQLSWLLLLTNLLNLEGGIDERAFFIGVALLGTFYLLKMCGYFNSLRLVPRKSDLFSILFALPVAVVLAGMIVEHSLSVVVAERWRLFAAGFVAAIGIFVCHYYLARIILKLRGGKKIVLDLLPLKATAVIKEFAGLGLAGAVEFLSKANLNEYLLRGAADEICLVVISKQSAREFHNDRALLRAHLAGIPIVDGCTMINELVGRVDLSRTDLWSYVLAALPQTAFLRAYGVFKLVLEPVIAAVLAVLLAPLLAVIAVLIKLNSPGPVFYRQVRTGVHDREFVLIKFRSMYEHAEDSGPQWSSGNDRRITSLGCFLRATRLDELPQLWNVVRGEMSFFGPRPERPEIYAKLKQEIPLFPMRTVVRPGLTGWAQVCMGYAASVEDSRAKLEYDLYYIQNMSPRLDLITLILTLQVIIFGPDVIRRRRYAALVREKSNRTAASA